MARYSRGSKTSNSAAWPKVWKNLATSSRPRWMPAYGNSEGPGDPPFDIVAQPIEHARDIAPLERGKHPLDNPHIRLIVHV